ncbi:MAG TPA: hypothetical protein VE130_11845 [Nitrososphaeraceae archaeon]|nr:hypothetical protein [Nitrososphaeraceae archaeon]
MLETISKYLHSQKISYIIISVIILALLLDISLTKISDLIRTDPNYNWRIGIFLFISFAAIIGHHTIPNLISVKQKEYVNLAILPMYIVHRLVRIVQYALSGVILLVIFQIFLLSNYGTNTLLAATVISYSLAIVMLGILAQRFFSWYRSHRDRVILFYGLSSAALLFNVVVIFLLALSSYSNSPEFIGLHVANLQRIITDPLQENLNFAKTISSVVAFVLMWLSTAALLKRYYHEMGRTKYYILISIPLVFFVIQFPSLLTGIFGSLIMSDPIFYGVLFTVVFFLSNTVGGIFFGVAFWTTARMIKENKLVRNYMVISAFGLVLFFISNSAFTVWINLPFPAFGLSSISYTGLSSYLILIGIYSSAVTVASDSKLRQSIKKFATNESRFLDNIGIAQMEEEIETRVKHLAKEISRETIESSGVDTEISEKDMIQYAHEVVQEVQKAKERKQ